MSELELLASSLAILAREAAPHLKEWGGQATAAALRSVVGEKAKQAAEALGLLRSTVEAKPLTRGSLEQLATEDLDDDEAAETEAYLRQQFTRILKKDPVLFRSMVEGLDGIDVRADGHGVAIGGDVEGSTIVTGSGNTVIRVSGGTVVLVQGSTVSDAPREVTAATARTAYLRWLKERAGHVALGGVDPALGKDEDRRLSLEAVYTALWTRTPRHSELEADAEDSEKASSPRGMAERQDEPPLSALEQLDRHRRLVLLGDPGSGKSTFVAFVALCMAGELLRDDNGIDLGLLTSPLPQEDGEDAKARQPWSREALFPIRVVLRDFVAHLPAEADPESAQHLWGFLAAELEKWELKALAEPLQSVLDRGEALVLLDGLDEVPEAARRREQICKALSSFAERYSKNRYVVTCRTYAYQKQAFRLRGFEEVAELAPFGEGQVRRFVRRWYSEVASLKDLSPAEARQRATLLEGAIFSSPRLQELAARPLLLTLMASLHAFRGGSLPEDREKLYAETVELLLDVWEHKQKRHEGSRELVDTNLLEYLKVERKAVLRSLQELAYEVHASQPELQGTADVALEKLVAKLLRMTPQDAGTAVNAAMLARYLSERSGILEERAPEVYAFPHRTFQEYLAARHLVEGSFEYEEIARQGRCDPGRWREVILLAAARLGPMAVWDLVEELAFDGEWSSSELAWGLHLAGHVVMESANLSQLSAAKQRRLGELVERLPSLLTSSKLPASERALAGAHLARLGDPRFDRDLWHLPVGESAGFVAVPGGEYVMGSDPEDADALDQEKPQHTVRLSPFWLARWPVTVAQFGAFVEASGFKIGDQDALEGVANHPVMLVSWDEARTYCEWLTERLLEVAPSRAEAAEDSAMKGLWRGLASGDLCAGLPSEAQWEAAARGSDGRVYPWGAEAPTREHANYDDVIVRPTSVGIYPQGRGPFGAEDQAGNVLEWCLDAWDEGAYRGRDGDPLVTGKKTADRVWRGGSWADRALSLRAAYRDRSWHRVRFGSLGFRVCVSVPEHA